MNSKRALTLLMVIVFILTACTLPTKSEQPKVDPNAIFTAAAQTVEVQLTQNALLNPTLAPETPVPPTSLPPAITDTPASPGATIPPLLATATLPAQPTAAPT